jgi:ribosome-associated protein
MIGALETASQPILDRRERTKHLKAPVKRVAKSRPRAKRPAESPLAKLLLSKLEDAKAEEIVKIGLDGKSTVADVMIVASGRSNRHVGAIADQLLDALKAGGAKNVRVEGMPHCDWVLLDAGEAIVHIFRPEVRSFYNLEKLWSDLAPDERLAS